MRSKAIFLSPAGAALTLVSFFLPWAKVSCAPIHRTVTGPSLGGLFWLVIPLGAAILLCFFYFMRRLAVGRSRPFIAAISGAALAIIVGKSLMLAENATSGVSGKAAGACSFKIEFGGVAVFGGLVISLVGALLAGSHGASGCKPGSLPGNEPGNGRGSLPGNEPGTNLGASEKESGGP